MKRPALTISAIQHVKSSTATNSKEVMAISPNGNTQPLILSPEAQDQLLLALLTAEPVLTPEQAEQYPGQQMERVCLRAATTRLFELADGTTVLEAILGPGKAIRILLPGLLPEALEQQLNQFRLPSSTTSQH